MQSLLDSTTSLLYQARKRSEPLIKQIRHGGNISARGSQDKGKTLLLVHIYRYLVLSGLYRPEDGVGNLEIKGPLGYGFTTLKGENLKDWLWECTHKPYRNKFVIIDEIDSEFPARWHYDKDQTEIALRMWHNRKLGNYNCWSSHLGRGSDLIFDLAANFAVIPRGPDFYNDQLRFTVINGFDLRVSHRVAHRIIETAGMYKTQELTEDTDEENEKVRPSVLKRILEEQREDLKQLKRKRKELDFKDDDLDFNAEMAALD